MLVGRKSARKTLPSNLLVKEASEDGRRVAFRICLRDSVLDEQQRLLETKAHPLRPTWLVCSLEITVAFDSKMSVLFCKNMRVNT